MFRSLLFIFISIFILTGCGGGTSSSSTVKEGTFIDNVVIGVKYINGSTEGFTDQDGKFPYSKGVVEFFIGNIKIGEINSLPEDGNVFVQDLVDGVERTNNTDVRVLKIARLLQSLDSNSETDEIEINQDDFKKFDDVSEDISNIKIDEVLSTKGFLAVEEKDVMRHITNSLKYYKIIEDNESPELKSSSIVNGASNIASDSVIKLIFTDDIQKSFINSSNIKLKNSNGESIPCTISHYFNELIITPINNLEYSTEYRLIIKDLIEDYGRNNLTYEGSNLDTIITFTVTEAPDTEAPVLSSSTKLFETTVGQSLILETVTATDNVDSNITVVQSGNVDFNKVGSYSIIYTATDSSLNSSSIIHTYKVNAIPDNESPILSSYSRVFTTIVGNPLSLETVTATDNVDSNITVVQSGNVDFNKVGSYSVTYTAIDSSLNSSSVIHQYIVEPITSSEFILHNGLVYNVLTSPVTGYKWLDRNLGATRICTESRDNDSYSSYEEYELEQKSCFGDYYQWGRNSDGHEKATSFTKTLANKIENLDNLFILPITRDPNNWFMDWTSKYTDSNGSMRQSNWLKTDGSSVCPNEFRVPTLSELKNELISLNIENRDDAFNSFLKIPYSSYTNFGTFTNGTQKGNIWTATIETGINNDKESNFVSTSTPSINWAGAPRFIGLPIRCIKGGE